MEKINLKIFENGIEKFNHDTIFEDKSYFEEYIEIKKMDMKNKKYKIIETDTGFYFYNVEGTKIEYKFTY